MIPVEKVREKSDENNITVTKERARTYAEVVSGSTKSESNPKTANTTAKSAAETLINYY